MSADGRAERRLRAIQEALERVCPTQRAAVEKRAAEMPVSLRLGYLRAVLGEVSPRQAIAAHCMECCGWERRGVGLCTAKSCPLYAYRPGRRSVT